MFLLPVEFYTIFVALVLIGVFAWISSCIQESARTKLILASPYKIGDLVRIKLHSTKASVQGIDANTNLRIRIYTIMYVDGGGRYHYLTLDEKHIKSV